MNEPTTPQENEDEANLPDQEQRNRKDQGGETGYEDTATEMPDVPTGSEVEAEVEQRK